jgi:hypothetical protein
MKWLKEKGHTIYRSQGKFNISQGNFREHLSSPPTPRFLGVLRVVHLFSFLSCPIMCLYVLGSVL